MGEGSETQNIVISLKLTTGGKGDKDIKLFVGFMAKEKNATLKKKEAEPCSSHEMVKSAAKKGQSCSRRADKDLYYWEEKKNLRVVLMGEKLSGTATHSKICWGEGRSSNSEIKMADELLLLEPKRRHLTRVLSAEGKGS